MATLSVDFDGTIVEDAYPYIGELKPNAKEVITGLFENGHDIIINTCRAGTYEADVYQFLDDWDIPYNYINCNLPEKVEHYGMDCRKISADVYIDDKNIIPTTDWDFIEKLLRGRGIETRQYREERETNETLT
jgi:hypothetical protein